MKKTKKGGALNSPSFAQDIGKELVMKVAGYGLGIGLVYFLVIRPVLQKVGVIQSSEDAEREKVAKSYGTSTESPFSPSYYKSVPGAVLVTRAVAEKLAAQLYDAIGNFSDDENAVFAALRQLKAKTQLSFVSEVFTAKYNADLYQYLRRSLGDSDMDVINGIVGSLNGLRGLGCNCQNQLPAFSGILR